MSRGSGSCFSRRRRADCRWLPGTAGEHPTRGSKARPAMSSTEKASRRSDSASSRCTSHLLTPARWASRGASGSAVSGRGSGRRRRCENYLRLGAKPTTLSRGLVGHDLHGCWLHEFLWEQTDRKRLVVGNDALGDELVERHFQRLHAVTLAGHKGVTELVGLTLANEVAYSGTCNHYLVCRDKAAVDAG